MGLCSSSMFDPPFEPRDGPLVDEDSWGTFVTHLA